MTWPRAETYRIIYTHEGVNAGKTSIIVSLDQGGYYKYENLPLERASFIIDLLRNEDPVWIATTDGTLQVSVEPVGEGE